jgi:hypothetical protein
VRKSFGDIRATRQWHSRRHDGRRERTRRDTLAWMLWTAGSPGRPADFSVGGAVSFPKRASLWLHKLNRRYLGIDRRYLSCLYTRALFVLWRLEEIARGDFYGTYRRLRQAPLSPPRPRCPANDNAPGQRATPIEHNPEVAPADVEAGIFDQRYRHTCYAFAVSKVGGPRGGPPPDLLLVLILGGIWAG